LTIDQSNTPEVDEFIWVFLSKRVPENSTAFEEVLQFTRTTLILFRERLPRELHAHLGPTRIIVDIIELKLMRVMATLCLQAGYHVVHLHDEGDIVEWRIERMDLGGITNDSRPQQKTTLFFRECVHQREYTRQEFPELVRVSLQPDAPKMAHSFIWNPQLPGYPSDGFCQAQGIKSHATETRMLKGVILIPACAQPRYVGKNDMMR
jgi:hypothetical protein